jgi:hypothetical protein
LPKRAQRRTNQARRLRSAAASGYDHGMPSPDDVDPIRSGRCSEPFGWLGLHPDHPSRRGFEETPP